MGQKVAIVNYGMGNLNSVKKRFDQMNIDIYITSEASEIKSADKIILPGVGHFGKAMEKLSSSGLIDVLNEGVLINKKPVLGICLGMQLMADNSDEGDAAGLGWINGKVTRFQFGSEKKIKVPHMGWNTVNINKKSLLFQDISSDDEFYFVHSYHFNCDDKTDILNTTEYGYSFVSAIEKENIFGVQYHPEKSHNAGGVLLSNFIKM